MSFENETIFQRKDGSAIALPEYIAVMSWPGKETYIANVLKRFNNNYGADVFLRLCQIGPDFSSKGLVSLTKEEVERSFAPLGSPGTGNVPEIAPIALY